MLLSIMPPLMLDRPGGRVHFWFLGAVMIRSITYDEGLAVGHEAIDSQHREWVTVANQLLATTDPGAASEDFTAALLHLIRYTRHHFATEEGLMEEWAYPRLEHQRRAHAQIMADLSASIDDRAPAHQAAILIRETLERWIVEHLLQEDLLLRDFLRSRSGPTEHC